MYKSRSGPYIGRSAKRTSFFPRRSSRPVRQYITNRVIPDETFIKLSYTDQIQLTGSQPANAYYKFAGNSLYDPDQSSSGNQPTGYDQWSSLYKSYRVYGSMIRIEARNGLATGGVRVALIPTNANQTTISTSTTMDGLMGNSNVKVKWLGLTTNDNGTAKLSMYRTTASVWGTDDITIESSYDGLMGNIGTGSDPSKLWWWNILGQNDDTINSTNVNVTADVTVTYYVKLFNPTIQPIS